MNKYIYHSIVDTLSLIIVTAFFSIAVHAVIKAAVSGSAFFSALGALFTGLLK